jgi:hypothetical protein
LNRQNDHNLTRENIVNPDLMGSTFESQKMGKKEFLDFVTATYSELAKSEAREVGGKSSIAVFCRMDIGIIFDESGQACYFVNEVERSLNTSLWSQCDGMPLLTLATTFGHAFHRWLCWIMSM